MTSRDNVSVVGTLPADELRFDHLPGDDLHCANAKDDVTRRSNSHLVDKADPAGDTSDPMTLAGHQLVATAMERWHLHLQDLITSELDACKLQDEGHSSAVTVTADLKQPGAASSAYGTYGCSPVPLCRRLPETEEAELERIERSYSTAFGALADELCSATEQGVEGIDLWVLRAKATVLSVRQFAEMLPEFVRLPKNVRTALMKASLSGGMLLRAAQLYGSPPYPDSWPTTLHLPSDVEDFSKAFPNVDRQVLVRHCQLAHECRELIPLKSCAAACTTTTPANSCAGSADLVVYALVQAVLVLSPEHAIPIEGKDRGSSGDGIAEDLDVVFANISDAQQHYTLLLRHYLEARHSFVRTADLLPELLQLVAEYKLFAVTFRRSVMSIEAFRREPLLVELLDC